MKPSHEYPGLPSPGNLIITKKPLDSPDIRPIGPDWADNLALLEIQLFPHPWSPQQFKDEMARDCGVVLGAFRDQNLIGFAVFWVLSPEIHLLNLGVAPGFQEQGHAKTIMRTIFSDCPTCTSLLLEVRASNQRARGLYESLGGTINGTRPGYYQDPKEDAVLMEIRFQNSETLTTE